MKQHTVRTQYHFDRPIPGTLGHQHVGNYWEFHSMKLGRRVGSYSDLEYDHNVLLEVDPSVETYCEQPIRVPAFIDDEIRWSRLDSWVKFKDGTDVFREIKYSRDIAKSREGDRLDTQLKVQRDWADRNGQNHEVVTEKTIRAKPLLLQNWKRILHYLTSHRGLPAATDNQVDAIMACVTPTKPLPIWVLIERMGPKLRDYQVRRIVFEQLMAGKLATSIASAPLGDKSLIRGV